MAVAYNFAGPRIVSDGLVLYMDAANPNSYNFSTPLTWRDISGNRNNGTLVNGPTFSNANGGSIVFDGVNDYVQMGSRENVGNTFTVNVWVQHAVLGGGFPNRRCVVSNSYTYSSGKGFYFITSGNNGSDFFISLGNDQKVAISTTGLIVAGTIYMLTARVNGSELIKLYRNGIEVPSYSSQTDGDVSLSYDVGLFAIGTGINLNFIDIFNGLIYCVQIYNRALTPTEILQNYNATKGRFGI
jgi:hypothetical protein